MEAVIFVGLQGSGKSTFYKEQYFSTHVRISLDLLRTRHRERLLLEACLQTGQPFVVDNTNPTRAERAVYVVEAQKARFRIVGCYFQSKVEDCKRRNDARREGERIPHRGIHGTAARMELPKQDEGFDELHYVRIDEDGRFVVEEWNDEV